jgi:alpha-beta hydrolase superfamily lysophospholipase
MWMNISRAGSAWGGRAQVGAALQELHDVKGNRDGLWNNETRPRGTPTGFVDQQPLLEKFKQFAGVGLSAADEIAQLKAFRSDAEKQWGQPVTTLDLSRMNAGELFAAQKAMALTRMGRTPSDVTEGFVRAAGTVDGQQIPARDIFWQRFKPVGEPSGKVVVVSPGFQETGRNFLEQIEKLNRLGHDVVVLDQQWAGHSDGKAGGLDRGFGVTRDVAAVAAFASTEILKDYAHKPGAEVVLFGNSMGAGPGVLGALTMNDHGKIHLEGAQMPKGLRALVQAPFLGATPNATNKVLGLASHIPVLNKLAAPAAGLPVLTSDPVAAQKGAQGAVAEDVRAQLVALNSALPDLQTLRGMWAAGQLPTGSIAIVQAEGDTLADPARTKEFAALMGSRAHLKLIAGHNHVLEQSPSEQGFAVDALQALLKNG